MQIQSIQHRDHAPRAPGTNGLAGLIAAIGRDGFAGACLTYINEIVPIVGLTIFRADGSVLMTSGDAAGRAETRSPYRGGVTHLGRDIALTLELEDTSCDLVLHATRDFNLEPAVSDALAFAGLHVTAALTNHLQMQRIQPPPDTALLSLDEIETCMAHMESDLSPRENAVCSRIIFGMTTYGIAVDLGIGEESVSTYRKRAYRRLGIACQRELLMIYLRQWHDVRPRLRAA